MLSRRSLFLSGLALSLLVAACSNSPTAPGVQPQVASVTDNFQYQVSNVQNFSGTASYTWQNTGTRATVNQSATLTAGDATVLLLDANGVQVYSSSLASNGTFQSSVGVGGELDRSGQLQRGKFPSDQFPRAEALVANGNREEEGYAKLGLRASWSFGPA